MKRLLLFCCISWFGLILFFGFDSVPQQISTDLVPPGQQSISEVKKQEEALKKWKEAGLVAQENYMPLRRNTPDVFIGTAKEHQPL